MSAEEFLAAAAALAAEEDEPEVAAPVQVPADLPEPGSGELAAPEQPAVIGCGHAMPVLAKFCPECGAPAQEVMEPPKWQCGHDNGDEARFCSTCGAPAGGAAPVVSSYVSVAASRPDISSWRPKREEELSPAERAARDRAHAEAIRMGAQDPGTGPLEVPQPGQDVQLIHFKEDGFTFAGTVWYRGQELRLVVGSPRWQQAQEWINMPEFAQMRRWQKVMFGPGPWPGLPYTAALMGPPGPRILSADGQQEIQAGPTAEELRMAEERERARNGAVPAMPVG
jgi:hypothetical protein